MATTGIFSASRWTGRVEDPKDASARKDAYMEKHYPAVAHKASLPLSTKLRPQLVDPFSEGDLAEYAALAEQLGVSVPDVTIEKFKAFLREHDIPTYSLREVTTYMDERAVKESKDKCGWSWRPLREKDNIENVTFGTAARREQRSSVEPIVITVASDFYFGPRLVAYDHGHGRQQYRHIESSCAVYDRVIPLHALRKVAAIDNAFGDKVAMFVSDYALAPAVEYPDPFLMAVINNPGLAKGAGRFVIDFWDEPGFGINQQLARE